MPRNATTALYTRVDNSFSNPVVGTTISPTDADTFFDDVEASMNSFIATSTSSVAVGLGAKTFTVQSGKSFLVGMSVQIFSDADHANYMSGTVTSYSSTTLVVDVLVIGGSGTLADWSIFTAGARGATGKAAGYAYSWLTDTTSADPTAGKVKANNATFASITEIYISETDADANGIAAVIAAALSGTSDNKCRLKLYDPVTPTNFMEFDATALTDHGGWNTITVTPRSNGGSFSAALALRADLYPVGDKGDTGVEAGVLFSWDAGTSDANPGTGLIRANNTSLTSATFFYVSKTSRTGSLLSNYLNSLDDSTSTPKGQLIITRASDGVQTMLTTGDVTDATNYVKLAVTYVNGQGTFSASDHISFQHYRTGDKGANGSLTASGTPTVGQFGVWTNSTTQKGVSITGLVKGNGASDPAAAVAGTDYLAPAAIGVTVQGYDVDTVKSDVAATLTKGYKASPYAAGTKSTGTYTPLYSDGNFQTATNGGAHTLAPPADDCTIIVQYTNNGSAGAITTSGFTKKTGDSITTVNGDDFFFFITKVGSFSHLHVQALQ